MHAHAHIAIMCISTIWNYLNTILLSTQYNAKEYFHLVFLTNQQRKFMTGQLLSLLCMLLNFQIVFHKLYNMRGEFK